MFDVNELVGRNCSQPGLKPWQPPQWCGGDPLPWNTSSVRMLLEHLHARLDPTLIAFELVSDIQAFSLRAGMIQFLRAANHRAMSFSCRLISPRRGPSKMWRPLQNWSRRSGTRRTTAVLLPGRRQSMLRGPKFAIHRDAICAPMRT